jgi:TRAP-type C4-dicarboxylate transport system substrate-binding protein
MLSWTLRLLTALLVLLPAIASAAPAKLKLSFFTSDRSIAYQMAIKPFVDAVNREGKGVVEIEVYFSGALGRVQRELPQQVLSGVADIAFIVPGQNPQLFTDNAAVELPGLFRDAREATLTHTRLIAAGALAGYQDFFVIGAYGTAPEIVTSRKPVASLADLKGQKIRVNNATEAKAVVSLGATPVLLAFNEASTAIAAGTIDGATVPAAQLFDVGFGSLTTYHYLLGTSSAPLALVMNRKVFDGLPPEARDLIVKYSGEWTAEKYIASYAAFEKAVSDRITTDQRRTVVTPSPADRNSAQSAFKKIVEDWAGADAHHKQLLALTETALAKIRADKPPETAH